MKLYFIRHGENQANLDRILSYKLVDYPLTSKGVEQARLLAGWLASHQIAGVYSSPLKRAFETAEIIARGLKIPEVRILEELREINVGRIDGLRSDEDWDYHDNIIRRWRQGEPEACFDQGEDRRSLENRLQKAVDRIIAENSHLAPEQGVAIIAHGGIINFGLPPLCGNIAPEQLRGALANTAVSIFEVNNEVNDEVNDVNKRQLKCTAWGICEHLPQN